MGLCADTPGCGCVLTSSTLTITGTGPASDPFNISGAGLQSVANYAALANPAAMPNGAAFFVESAQELVVVRGGKYAIPGQLFYELTGNLSPLNPTGSTTATFVATSVWPPAPFAISGGAITMDSKFHPAEFSADRIGPFLKTDDARVDVLTVSVGGDPNTYELATEVTRWEDDTDTLTVIPVLRSLSTVDSSQALRPFLLSTGALSIGFKGRYFGETLTSPQAVGIGLNWSIPS